MNNKLIDKRLFIPFFFFLLFISYATSNIGVISEINVFKSNYSNINLKIIFNEYLVNNSPYKLNPIGFFMDFIYGTVLSHSIYLTAFYKISITTISSLFLFFFFRNFFNEINSFIYVFILIFLPNADSLIYSSAHRYLLSFSLVLFAFNFTVNNKLIYVLTLNILALLICYISIIPIFALSFFFLLKKKYKLSFIYSIIFLTFVLFYFYLNNASGVDINRVNNFNLLKFFKNFIFTSITMIDSTFGISFLQKIFFTILDNPLLFIVFFSINFFLLLSISNYSSLLHNNQFKNFNDFFFISLIILITSLIVFSLNDRYPFIAFSLGNRINLFSNFFLIATIILFLNKYLNKYNKYLFIIVFSIFISSGITVSKHWSNFSVFTETSKNKIEQICLNLKSYEHHIFFVKNLSYSKLNNYGHIEYLVTPWVANTLCNKNRNITILPLSNQIHLDNNKVYWNKFNRKYDYNSIYLIDSNYLNLIDIPYSSLNVLLQNSIDKRHWAYENKIIFNIVNYLTNDIYDQN